MTDLVVDAATTALVLLDVQNFIVGLPTVPLDGRAVLANAVRLAEACRRKGILTILVRVDSGHDNALLLKPLADMSMPKFDLPPGSHDFAPEIGPKPGDVVVTKHSWGAFHETDLDTHLRRRAMKTLILAGFTTNYAVESTARQAHERGYTQILVSDAMATFSLAEHEHPLKTIFPRIARIRTTGQVIAALG
jgi:nicotinamidase-related amidase